MYGYQLLQELDGKSKGFFKMKEGTLYPVLYRLEDAGFITSLWEEPERGGIEKRPVPRKYYQITQKGITEFARLVSELHGLINGINLILEEEPKNGQ